MTVKQPARWRRYTSLDQSNPLIPYLLLTPHGVFYLAFFVFPIGYGLVISLQRWNPLRKDAPFVGLEFYRQLFDPSTIQSHQFWRSMVNTLFFTAVTAPLVVALALVLALLLNRPLRGRAFFRSVFFLPTVLSVTVASLLWKWMFQDRIGLVDIALSQVGVHAPRFLATPWLAWLPIVLTTLWWSVGQNMMLYLAGLAGIPESYYEAAQLDGAGGWQLFRYVTLPLLTPTTLFVSVTTALAAFQMFGQGQIITGGEPKGSTQSTIMYITQQAFTNQQMSSATAMSFVFGAVMMLVTAVQFRAMTRGIARPA